MRVEVITPNADPDQGGFGTRVHSLVSMFSKFAEVDVVLTHWFDGPRVPGVRYHRLPIRDGPGTRLQRLRTYYRTRFPRREIQDRPDLVVVESLELLGLHQYGPSVPFILDEHNVYWDLLRYDLVNAPFFRGWMGRRASVRRLLLPRLLDRARRFEIEAIRKSARTLVTSELDRRALLEASQESPEKVRVLPNCIDTARVPAYPDPSGSRRVVFIGDFAYGPNREAAAYVARLALDLPDAEFLLVGSSPPTTASWPGNVRATGRVPDLDATLRDAAVCIAPLQNGSGTRLKILTYLAAGRAVVATSKACEGLPVVDGEHLLVRDDPTRFRVAVDELLRDPGTRRHLASQGRALVASTFDWRCYVDWLRDFSAEVCTASRGGGWAG